MDALLPAAAVVLAAAWLVLHRRRRGSGSIIGSQLSPRAPSHPEDRS
jgi:hypothetical protein